jgi:hypothetical protein
MTSPSLSQARVLLAGAIKRQSCSSPDLDSSGKAGPEARKESCPDGAALNATAPRQDDAHGQRPRPATRMADAGLAASPRPDQASRWVLTTAVAKRNRSVAAEASAVTTNPAIASHLGNSGSSKAIRDSS